MGRRDGRRLGLAGGARPLLARSGRARSARSLRTRRRGPEAKARLLRREGWRGRGGGAGGRGYGGRKKRAGGAAADAGRCGEAGSEFPQAVPGALRRRRRKRRPRWLAPMSVSARAAPRGWEWKREGGKWPRLPGPGLARLCSDGYRTGRDRSGAERSRPGVLPKELAGGGKKKKEGKRWVRFKAREARERGRCSELTRRPAGAL